jgi:hypothetical protein
MDARTLIAKLVESMLADGAEHDAIVRAVEDAELASSAKPVASVRNRGTRLPADWQPSPECVGYAAERGFPEQHVELEAEKFKNYWTAKSGAGATKRDWDATWRNWILNAMEGRHVAARRAGPGGAHSAAGRSPAGADAVLAGMGRLARRLGQSRDAKGPGDKPVAEGPDAARRLDAEGGRT